MRMYPQQKYEVYSVCAFAGGCFASAGAERSLLLYGGPEHAEDLDKTVVKVEASAPVVSRERLVGRQSVDDAHVVREARPKNSTRVHFQEVDSTSDHVQAPLKGLMAQAAEAAAGREQSTITKSGYPAEDREDLLKKRRAKLMANSNLDITMSDFRRQFVDTSAATEKQGSDDTGVHAYAASGSASRGLPYISEDMASNDNIDDIPDWGISSRGLSSQGTRDDRFSVDSKSSVTSMTSINVLTLEAQLLLHKHHLQQRD